MEIKNFSSLAMNSGKALYEKPTSQVYEIEAKGAILAGSGETETGGNIPGMGYETPWE